MGSGFSDAGWKTECESGDRTRAIPADSTCGIGGQFADQGGQLYVKGFREIHMVFEMAKNSIPTPRPVIGYTYDSAASSTAFRASPAPSEAADQRRCVSSDAEGHPVGEVFRMIVRIKKKAMAKTDHARNVNNGRQAQRLATVATATYRARINNCSYQRRDFAVAHMGRLVFGLEHHGSRSRARMGGRFKLNGTQLSPVGIEASRPRPVVPWAQTSSRENRIRPSESSGDPFKETQRDRMTVWSKPIRAGDSERPGIAKQLHTSFEHSSCLKLKWELVYVGRASGLATAGPGGPGACWVSKPAPKLSGVIIAGTYHQSTITVPLGASRAVSDWSICSPFCLRHEICNCELTLDRSPGTSNVYPVELPALRMLVENEDLLSDFDCELILMVCSSALASRALSFERLPTVPELWWAPYSATLPCMPIPAAGFHPIALELHAAENSMLPWPVTAAVKKSGNLIPG
ncbi:hypothetical protein B0H11DRAFT_2184840 [Mycena galericulata]|nr:hypothetical protein B0H11DRAFT_2184840 [Mycena galericulata]